MHGAISNLTGKIKSIYREMTNITEFDNLYYNIIKWYLLHTIETIKT